LLRDPLDADVRGFCQRIQTRPLLRGQQIRAWGEDIRVATTLFFRGPVPGRDQIVLDVTPRYSEVDELLCRHPIPFLCARDFNEQRWTHILRTPCSRFLDLGSTESARAVPRARTLQRWYAMARLRHAQVGPRIFRASAISFSCRVDFP